LSECYRDASRDDENAPGLEPTGEVLHSFGFDGMAGNGFLLYQEQGHWQYGMMKPKMLTQMKEVFRQAGKHEDMMEPIQELLMEREGSRGGISGGALH